MPQISYPEHPVWGDEAISVQPLPKVISDLCNHLGIEPDYSVLESLVPIEDRVALGIEQHKNHPAVQKRKKTELLHQANQETIDELTRKRDALEQQRLEDAEAGEQNLETLEELSSLKAKLEILTEENAKLNGQVFDNLQAENHSYITLINTIRDAVYHERCEARAELQEEIEKKFNEISSYMAGFVALDQHVDFTRIENDIKRGLNL